MNTKLSYNQIVFLDKLGDSTSKYKKRLFKDGSLILYRNDKSLVIIITVYIEEGFKVQLVFNNGKKKDNTYNINTKSKIWKLLE